MKQSASTIAQWNEWLLNYNSSYARMSKEQQLQFLHNLVGKYPDNREKKEIQKQIDELKG